MQEVVVQQDGASECGFSMGQRLLELLKNQQEETTTQDHWSLLRALVAEVHEQRYLRATTSLPENMIAALLYANGALELPTIPELPTATVAT